MDYLELTSHTPPLRLCCAHGHFVSDDYADQYVRTQNEGVVVDDPELGLIADVAVLQRANRPGGAIYCPQRGLGGCDGMSGVDWLLSPAARPKSFDRP